MGEEQSPDESPTVLVVDDDMAQRVMVREALEQAGFAVEEAEDGQQGLDVIERMRLDFVLLDVMMPVLDGFEVCARLRGSPKFAHLPVLMVTGLENVQSIERAFEVGATYFLTKPINWALLSYQVRYVLRNCLMEQELRKSMELAESANRAKSEFLAMMSHELRTPLNAIIGFSELIKNEALGPIGNTKYHEFSHDIHASGEHLLALINDILDLSKIEFGKESLNESETAVSELLCFVHTMMRERAGEGGIELEFETHSELPPLYVDERKVKQILINLLSNAIKFTTAGGKVTLRTWCRAESGYVFQIADTGIGIALKDIPKALSPFSQVDSNLARIYEGTGLGLPLTKALVELHSGSFDLQSEVGIGTTVTVRFPAERVIAGGLNAQLEAS